jgi:L-aminoacid ligase-like protein
MPPPGRVRAVRGLDAVRRMPGVLDADVFVGAGDRIPPVTVGLHRAGFVITGATSRDEAVRLGHEAEARVEFAYEAGSA